MKTVSDILSIKTHYNGQKTEHATCFQKLALEIELKMVYMFAYCQRYSEGGIAGRGRELERPAEQAHIGLSEEERNDPWW